MFVTSLEVNNIQENGKSSTEVEGNRNVIVFDKYYFIYFNK